MRCTEFSRANTTYRFAEPDELGCIVDLFNPVWLENKNLTSGVNQAGRGSVHVFDHADNTYVLRAYHRGGFVRHLSADRYWWTGLSNTRPWQEFSLLAELCSLDLPSPVPYACCVSRSGFSYTGSLITHMIQNTETLAQKLCRTEVPEAQWFAIGQCIRRFHDASVYHGDLNADNILLNYNGEVFLIDFDKSGFRNGHGRSWKFANLKRLQRSIMKCRMKSDVFFFSPQNWETLRGGYLSTG